MHSTETVSLECNTLIPITARKPNDGIYFDLLKEFEGSNSLATPTITRIGDCLAPGLTADAIHSGHRFARELGFDDTELSFKRERIIATPYPRN